LSAPPHPLAAIVGGEPTSKGEGREGNGKREGRGWGGGREGEGGEGRLASHTFYALQPRVVIFPFPTNDYPSYVLSSDQLQES